MRQFIRRTMRPSAYHGHGKNPPFFEGWYFKLVDSTEQHRYAIIPGIFLNKDPSMQHAFVQILNGQTGHGTYHTYPTDAFRAANDTFDVWVGANHFTDQRILLDLGDDERTVSGEIHFDDVKPWPVTWTSPGIMGWYAWVPFMECYHGVVSLDHGLHGGLEIDSKYIDFTGGRGYIEKDWGQAFPAGYVWQQSNHFNTPETCLTASIAIIPWIGRSFPGFIAGLWHQQQLYRFATYTGAKTEKLHISDTTIEWVVSSRKERLEMVSTRAAGGLLYAPTKTDMHKRVNETLNATVEVRLSRNGQMLFHETGRNAGLEVAGDTDRLLTMR